MQINLKVVSKTPVSSSKSPGLQMEGFPETKPPLGPCPGPALPCPGHVVIPAALRLPLCGAPPATATGLPGDLTGGQTDRVRRAASPQLVAESPAGVWSLGPGRGRVSRKACS